MLHVMCVSQFWKKNGRMQINLEDAEVDKYKKCDVGCILNDNLVSSSFVFILRFNICDGYLQDFQSFALEVNNVGRVNAFFKLHIKISDF